MLWNAGPYGNSVWSMTHALATSDTEIVVRGPFRKPAQMLANQTYAGHKSVHDDESAARLGLAGAPIEGPTHFSQFEPLAAALWGDRWFSHGCISAHFQNMVIEGEEVQAQLTLPTLGATSAHMDAMKADATPVLTGTVSIGPDHGETELSARLATARSRAVGSLYVIDQLTIGLRGPADDTAMVTPQAAACAAEGNRNATASAATMERLSSTGAKAAAANLSWALSRPACSVTSVMKSR